MSFQVVLLPLFAQVALTFVLMFWMGSQRVGAIKRKETRMADVALGQLNWPPRVQQISNCYASQFQVPLLFYVLFILVIVTHHADLLFVALAWVFVLLRILHAYIHTGTNYVPHRFNAFLAGAVVLLVMWIIFMVRIVFALS
jgi:hypothetical protein